jgi:hypothetical protein
MGGYNGSVTVSGERMLGNLQLLLTETVQEIYLLFGMLAGRLVGLRLVLCSALLQTERSRSRLA